MTIPQTLLNQLFQSMSEYNPVTDAVMGKIAIALQPLAMAIIGILFLVEWTNYSKKFDTEDGGMTVEVMMNIAIKYMIAAALIASSGLIIDAMMWFGSQMSQWINSIIENPEASDKIPPMGQVKLWQRPIVFLFYLFAYVAVWLATLITTVLIFLRSIQLFIVKAIAPVLIAFFVSEELKPIAVNFFKHVMALVLQGALLVLIVGLIPIITNNDFLSAGSVEGGIFQGAATVIVNIFDYITLILKYVVIIIVLVGSQGMAKRFVGVN